MTENNFKLLVRAFNPSFIELVKINCAIKNLDFTAHKDEVLSIFYQKLYNKKIIGKFSLTANKDNLVENFIRYSYRIIAFIVLMLKSKEHKFYKKFTDPENPLRYIKDTDRKAQTLEAMEYLNFLRGKVNERNFDILIDAKVKGLSRDEISDKYKINKNQVAIIICRILKELKDLGASLK